MTSEHVTHDETARAVSTAFVGGISAGTAFGFGLATLVTLEIPVWAPFATAAVVVLISVYLALTFLPDARIVADEFQMYYDEDMETLDDDK